MRVFPQRLFVAIDLGLLNFLTAFFDAAATTVTVEPTILDQFREALGSLVLLIITVVAAFLARHLPGLLEAARLWLVERATSERVQRINSAIDVALDAGDDPEAAARIVRAKLPQTLKRSGKSDLDIEDEAETLRRARRTATSPAMK